MGLVTNMSMILGEELDVDWQKVQTLSAPVNSVYKNPENSGETKNFRKNRKSEKI